MYKYVVFFALLAVALAAPKPDPQYVGYTGLGYGGLGYSNLGYSNLGYSNLGYSNLGYSNLGYGNLGYYGGYGLGNSYYRGYY